MDGPSVQTAPDGYRRIVWMIKWMIKAHPTENRKAYRHGLPPIELRERAVHRWRLGLPVSEGNGTMQA